MMENKLFSNNELESKINNYEICTEFLTDQNKNIQNKNLIEFISNINNLNLIHALITKEQSHFLNLKELH